MFWRRKQVEKENGNASIPPVTYDEAREATRRAAFLTTAGQMSDDEEYKEGLRQLFAVCRGQALSSGTALGMMEAQIDSEISTLCDQDADRLKAANDEQFQSFAAESGQIVKRFLDRLNL